MHRTSLSKYVWEIKKNLGTEPQLKWEIIKNVANIRQKMNVCNYARKRN